MELSTLFQYKVGAFQAWLCLILKIKAVFLVEISDNNTVKSDTNTELDLLSEIVEESMFRSAKIFNLLNMGTWQIFY